jgi:gluconolactonase
VNRAFVPIGSDLHRPECVLATYRGDLFTSDSRGGVMHIRPDRSQVLLLRRLTSSAGCD